jgi:rhamnose utilization protein RhaD (predicted bifunctional aldolase and dehydrogenase)
MAKEFKPVAFKAKIDGEVKDFEIVTPKFIVPGFGVLTAEDAAKNAEALAYMVENQVGSIREIVSKSNSKK